MCCLIASRRDYSNIYENLEQRRDDDKMHQKKFSKAENEMKTSSNDDIINVQSLGMNVRRVV